MPTINEVIERVDKIKPCSYGDKEKARWLMELEGKLFLEVLQGEGESPPSRFPEDGGKPLIAEFPYDNIYDLYLQAMIDFHNREIQNYNNSMTMYAVALDEFKRWYRRSHMPRSASGFRNVL